MDKSGRITALLKTPHEINESEILIYRYFNLLNHNSMNISSVSYENSNLWKKSGELIEKTGTFEPVPEEPHHSLFVQFQKAVFSIQQDIQEAYSQSDQQYILYHFSKAKSSCLIVEEMLIKFGTTFSLEHYAEYMNSLGELKTILDNYIHLSQINLVIEKNRQDQNS